MKWQAVPAFFQCSALKSYPARQSLCSYPRIQAQPPAVWKVDSPARPANIRAAHLNPSSDYPSLLPASVKSYILILLSHSIFIALFRGLICGCHVSLTEPFEDALRNQTLGPVLSKAASVECISPVSPRAPDAKMLEELDAEPWYQGEMSRKEAEALLQEDGDFLVRKSTTNPGSFVLTGMHNGQAKHLLLVDPEGTVSTFQWHHDYL